MGRSSSLPDFGQCPELAGDEFSRRISPKTNLHGGCSRRCWGFEWVMRQGPLLDQGDLGAMDLPSPLRNLGHCPVSSKELRCHRKGITPARTRLKVFCKPGGREADSGERGWTRLEV